MNFNAAYLWGDFFFLWSDWDTTNVGDSLSYVPNEIADRQEMPINVDPYLTYFDKKGNKHNIKGRAYYVRTRDSNDENTDAMLYFGEYTFHSSLKPVGLDFVTGVMATYSDIDSEIFSKRKSKNGAAFLQIDKKFFDKLTFTGGFRVELFKLDTIDVTIRPIGRFGLNYQAAKATYIRASFGQGYRFPSIAEKFVRVIRSGQYVVPNVNLEPERSWSAEIGLKQGFQISSWFGYLDFAGFVTRYKDMIEFARAPNDVKDEYFPRSEYPGALFAFWSENITDSRISGLEISALGQGKIFGVKTNFLMGYTYIVPIDLNYDPDDPKYANRNSDLNWRFRHSAKGDIESTYKGFTAGLTAFINSFMTNIDPLVGLANGIKDFRENNKNAEFVLDARIAYDIFKDAKLSIIAKNVTNNQYSQRPGMVEAPRNYTVQLAYEF